MDGRPTWTDCDEAGDYVVPNALSQRNLVSRPDLQYYYASIEDLDRPVSRAF